MSTDQKANIACPYCNIDNPIFIGGIRSSIGYSTKYLNYCISCFRGFVVRFTEVMPDLVALKIEGEQ